MKVVKEFSRFADEYDNHNIIQEMVSKKLCQHLSKNHYENILDIGAGRGAIYQQLSQKNISFKNFVALDFSQEMLDLHPSNNYIQKQCVDFNQQHFTSSLKISHFDLIVSSSALQWSSNLSNLFKEILPLGENFLFSFFTANTFKTLHQTVNINSPILTKEEIIEALDKFFVYELEIIEYTLAFNSVREMLHYIKKSGVSGGVKQLGYKQMKNLMLNYKLDYLEFEVMFIKVIEKR